MAIVQNDTLSTAEPCWSFQRDGRVLTVGLAGCWTIRHAPPAMAALLTALQGVDRLVWDCSELQDWDSLLVSRMRVLQSTCSGQGVIFDTASLPPGVASLLELAAAVPPERQPVPAMTGMLAGVSRLLLLTVAHVRDSLVFTGEMAIAVKRFLTGQSQMRARDFWYFVADAGPGSLGIISLVSLLAGVILAYLGAVQLRQFGAQVYVANLVSIGMTREMGALMTAIIMAGRTGAAYAAQLGTMQANEEVDALKIMGINPIDFLALPRLFALVLVLPLLTLYSDVLGMLGGSLIAGSMDIGLTQYISQTQESIGTQQIFAGLFKSAVFAVLIAQAGCHWGLRSGRSSTDVGHATTRAVVTALVAIIVADSIINVLYDRLGI